MVRCGCDKTKLQEKGKEQQETTMEAEDFVHGWKEGMDKVRVLRYCLFCFCP